MSYFMQNGDVFYPTPGKDSVLDNLPVGNFIVIETMQGLMFKRVDSFDKPGRMYGKINDHADRILHTFIDRPRTTGVLLSGEKGSGKSQLARNISYAGYEMDLPTILVNAPFCGDAFNALLASIEQPAIVLMDEFEKVYSNREHQEAVLTLLDGMMTSKKLFVLTVNDKFRVNDHMKNRPGRIFYSLEFSGLEADFIREYCEDNLFNKDDLDSVMKVSALFRAFNFDMLKALVEEMNRYKESAFESIAMLNAKPISSEDRLTYEVQVVTANGRKSHVEEVHDLPMANNQGIMQLWMTWDAPLVKEDRKALAAELELDAEDASDFKDAGYVSRQFVINSKDLRKVDADAGIFQFRADRDSVVTFQKKRMSAYDIKEIM